MKNKVLLFCFMLLFTSAFDAAGVEINVIPLPMQITRSEGVFVLTPRTTLFLDQGVPADAATPFCQLLQQSAGIDPGISRSCRKSGLIHYQMDISLPQEGYSIEVTPARIWVKASSNSGFFYASTTLLQLLPVEVFSGSGALAKSVSQWTVPCVSIRDQPRYGYRGFMLDVSRYFVPKKEIFKLLDLLAFHKINKFHWHLVDDNGWRLEIRKYPKLTAVGAYRTERVNVFPMRRNPERGEPVANGGYYSQEDVREIVAYAAVRHIEVIPEIEMPAHTNSSLAAYPELTCPHVRKQIEGVLSGIGGKHASTIYCAGNDGVFKFLEDVIDEVIELFPSKMIHIGGDEAWKENWKTCSLCQKRMKEHNIPNEEELQSYFICRMNDYLLSKGRQLAGWDELADSRLPEGSVIYGWRGLGQSAVKAARQGHDVVLTPARKLYLIRYQGAQWFEPFTYFGNNTLRDVYEYDMQESGFDTPELQARVKGIQASMWCEFITSPEGLEYMLFPRLAAFAEAAWSKKGKEWSGFLNRLDYTLQVYDYKGVTYSNAMYNLFHKIESRNGKLFATLSTMSPDLTIRYTTDVTLPTVQSRAYDGAFEVKGGETVIAQAFRNDKPVGQPLHLSLIDHLALGAKAVSEGKEIGLLTNGLLGSERFSDGEYVDCYDSDFEVTLELDGQKKVSTVYVGSLVNAGMGVYAPRKVTVSLSKDGQLFSEVVVREYGDDRVFVNSFHKNSLIFDFETRETRYVRLRFDRPGIVPDGLPREGEKTRMVFDEIRVK